MHPIDRFLPAARHVELDHVDVAAPPERAYAVVRRFDLARSPLGRALFSLRTLPDALSGRRAEPLDLRLDTLTEHAHGFRLLDEVEGSSFTVGAVGEFWKTAIAYDEVPSQRFAAYRAPGRGKIAWEIRCEPRGEIGSRIVVEVRIDATDDAAWARFRRYFALIGPFSRLIRRHVLTMVARELGALEAAEDARALPGDELVPDAVAQITDFVDIAARPDAIWPWIAQMGCRRAGWYSWDLLDNGGEPSARVIHPEWQEVRVGDVLPATPTADDGFLVLRVDRGRVLVLGGTVDLDAKRTLPMGAPRPERFWQTSWAFVLEPLDEETTRLHVRGRVAVSEGGSARLVWMHPIHAIMERKQLREIKARAEASGA